ncbi:MFS transporter [Microbacterium sp. 1P10UB]|uniref:MFS transporter n=1 Tax=unclassified Microbacterium TaxID=2609290 RepID=UPI0039A251C0
MTLGNVLEWFDFSVYAVVAVYIAATFFATTDPIAALLPTFAVFGAAFVARPLGALILGPMMDRRGRKSVMLLSMLLMAGGSVLIGFAPGYATVGILGALLVVVGRLAQGFSAGGEFGSAAVFLSEWAPDGRRGFYVSFQQVATSAGLVFGLVFASLLTLALGPQNMAAWGWRIPFLFGGVLAIVVFILRRRIDDTPVFRAMEEQRLASPDHAAPVATVEESNVRGFLTTMGIVVLWTMVSFITFNFMPAFAVSFVGVDQQAALIATAIGAAMSIVLIPLAGAISDRVGRRPLIIVASIAYLVLSFPMFWMMVSLQSFGGLVLFQLILAPFTAAVVGVGPATITELFGSRRRGAMVSIAAALTTALFGGFGPFIATWLIQVTGTPTAPAFYLMAGAVITLITALTLSKRLGFENLKD